MPSTDRDFLKDFRILMTVPKVKKANVGSSFLLCYLTSWVKVPYIKSVVKSVVMGSTLMAMC